MDKFINQSAMAEEIRSTKAINAEFFAKMVEDTKAVTIVRCKDCKWYEPENSVNPPFCNNPADVIRAGMPPIFFCYDGERKVKDG